VLSVPKGLPWALSAPKRVHGVSLAPKGSPDPESGDRAIAYLPSASRKRRSETGPPSHTPSLESDRQIRRLGDCSLRRDRQIPSPATAPLHICPALCASVGQRQARHPLHPRSSRIVRSDGLGVVRSEGIARSGTSYQQQVDVIHGNHSRFLQQVEPGTGPGIVFWMLHQIPPWLARVIMHIVHLLS